MAGRYSPRIVTDGLLLYPDALNRKSYVGTGTAVLDLSGNGYNLALTNGPIIQSDGSISFDASNDYATIASNSSFLPSSAYTKMVFIYPTSFSFGNNILSGGDTSGQGQHAFWLGTTTNFRAGHNGSWSTVVSTTSLSLNSWAFGAVSFSTTSGWRLYVNGIQEATSASTTTYIGTGNVYLGSFNAASNLFSGRIACPLIYNRVLTADEILQNYNALKGRFGF
jgi:hypothetical protein